MFWIFWAAIRPAPAVAQCSFPLTVASAGQLGTAISCYNGQTAPATYTIALAADIALTGTLPSIDNANGGVQLALQGAGHTVDGQGIAELRIFEIRDATIVGMKQITITGGSNFIPDFPTSDPAYYGGGVYNLGVLTIDDSVIDNNIAENGGGIFNEGMLSLYNSIVSANLATDDFGGGGAIYNTGTVTLTNSTLRENVTSDGFSGEGSGGNSGQGGGVYNQGKLTIIESAVHANRTGNGGDGISGDLYGGWGGNGGGVFNDGALVVQSSTIISNSTGSGGDAADGIESDGGLGGLGGRGGGIYSAGPLTVTDTIFLANRTGAGGNGGAGGVGQNGGFGGFGGDGGGVFAENSTTILRSRFIGNGAGAGGQGGSPGAGGEMAGFDGWQGAGGGLAYFEFSGPDPAPLLVVNNLFSFNHPADDEGIALSLFDNIPQITHNTFANSDPSPGSAIRVSCGDMSSTNNIFANFNIGIENCDSGATVTSQNDLYFNNITDTVDVIVTNKLTGDPAFLDSGNDDYRLATASAAIDVGADAGVTEDFEQEARPQGHGFDVGFDELTVAAITFSKQVVGGEAAPEEWHFDITGGAQNISHMGQVLLPTGVYTVTEDSGSTHDANYAATDAGGACSLASGVIQLTVGDIDATCVITNTRRTATLKLVKNVVNDNGGAAGPDDFDLFIGGAPVTSGVSVTVLANVPITIDEAGLPGYALVGITGAGCPTTLGDTITLDPDEGIVCTITNDDIAPTITLIKSVVNNNGGGTLGVPASGPGPNDFGLSVGGVAVASGVAQTILANIPITINEAGLPGYTFVEITGAGCPASLGANVTLEPDEHIVCTLVNDDIAPTVTLHKVVTNDDTADPNGFGLQVNGTAVDSGQTLTVTANTPVVISELGLSGYAFVAMTGSGCPSSLANAVTLPLGAALVCTLSNQRIGVEIHRVGDEPLVEGGSDVVSYTINLIGVPTAPVTVTLQPDAQVAVDPAMLVFTPGNGATAQVIQVLAVDDTVVEGNHTGVIGHSASSPDPNYSSPELPYYNDGATANHDQSTVVVDILDNDTASVLFRKTVSLAGYPPACSEQSTIQAPVNTTIVYCFTIRNTGNITFTMHTLTDDHLGALLVNEEILLAPMPASRAPSPPPLR